MIDGNDHKHILILVPHPDDEVVACAAALRRAQEQGADVYALYLTHGCLARETLWPWQRKNYDQYVARRRSESEKVSEYLGITPIGRPQRAARHLWCELPEVFSEIQQAIQHYKIDEVWLPAYEGGNADHDGLNALGTLLLPHVKVIEFAEYNYFKGRTHSQEFPYPNGSETVLTLTPEEKAQKRSALDLYGSEKLNLSYVKTERECFRSLAHYDYGKPPHPGTLWYQRFQWVPFRHPQVDFTNPQDVCRALVQFLADQT